AELLAELHQRGDIALGLLTGNLRDGARHKLAHYRIDHYFQFGGFGDQHCDRNDVAREAVAALTMHSAIEIQTDDIWVIGDTPLDIQCARSVGVRVLAVATGMHSVTELAVEQPDLLLPDLSDATDFVLQLKRLK